MIGYTEIEDARELAKLNERLSTKLKRVLPYKKRRKIGYPQDSFDADVFFRKKSGDNIFWWAKGEKPGSNFLGHAKPDDFHSLNIEVQFNISIPKFSRRLGGSFLRDKSTDKIILAHRGIVTLGHSRIKKEGLFSEINATLAEANTDAGVKEFWGCPAFC